MLAHARARFGDAARRARRIFVRRRSCRRASRQRVTPSASCWSARPSSASRWKTVPPDTIVVHGEEDDVVPLADVLDWARPQQLPIVVFPGCGHFFHGRLPQLQRMIAGMWHRQPSDRPRRVTRGSPRSL